MSCKRITAGNYYDIMNENDYRNALDFAREKGIREGHIENMQKGIAKAAKAMLGSGMDTDGHCRSDRTFERTDKGSQLNSAGHTEIV